MVYIITGIAKAGKSFLTNYIVQHKKIGYFSSDLLMMSLAKGNKSIGINPNASDISVSKQLEPYLHGMVQTVIENQIDYIFEGVHFQPDFVKNLIEKYPSKIKVVFLGYRQMDTLKKVEELKYFGPSTQNHWYSHMNDQELTQLAIYMKNECEKLYQMCVNYKLPYFEIDNIVAQAEELMTSLFE